ncbi:MAG: hypothetical protein GXP62_15675 [Oligoflexia bacterium]|nr:hypothetical protein [Oligoflexia bacterium]
MNASPRIHPLSHVILAVGLLSACRNKIDSIDTATECSVAVANAGLDAATALGGTVTLDGSASTICSVYQDAGSATYDWTFERVPVDSRLADGALSANATADAITTSFTPDTTGDYVVSLTITDPSGTSAADPVVISIESGNATPTADCGPDVGAQVGDRVDLDGTASVDPEGAELSYSWSLSVAPDCSELGSTDVYNADSAVASVTPDCQGLYLMSLVVSDGENWSEPDYCTIDVADGNRLPEADAGQSAELPFCTDNPLQLSGWGSYDLDGDALAYQWTVSSVPSASTVSDADFSDPTAIAPTITWDLPGTYSFELQVFDGMIWSAPDIVSYTIAAEDTNTSPITNAGSDQRIEAIAECVSSSYVWTCGDCPESSAILDGASTYDPDGDPLTYLWTEATHSVTWSNNASAITDIIFPAQPAEFGVSTELEVEAVLTATDCMESDSDTVTVTYTCTGAYLGD